MRIENLTNLVQYIAIVLNRIIPFIISLTLLMFIYGLMRLILANGEHAKSEGKQIISFGIIALAVMVSVWGLVNLLIATAGLQGASTAPQGPGVPRFK